jgi:hypothetical protein
METTGKTKRANGIAAICFVIAGLLWFIGAMVGGDVGLYIAVGMMHICVGMMFLAKARGAKQGIDEPPRD